MQRTVLFAVSLVMTAILLGAGCSHMSVRHMSRTPWQINAPLSMTTKYWRFAFTAVPLRDRFGVRGTAIPLMDKLPEWATAIDELWLMAYLSDSRGRVIAKDLQVYLPRPLDPAGVGFEFVLEPEDLGREGQLYLAFGYRMVLTDADGRQAGETEPHVFFANEGALRTP